jgi:hypothetical protein
MAGDASKLLRKNIQLSQELWELLFEKIFPFLEQVNSIGGMSSSDFDSYYNSLNSDESPVIGRNVATNFINTCQQIKYLFENSTGNNTPQQASGHKTNVTYALMAKDD